MGAMVAFCLSSSPSIRDHDPGASEQSGSSPRPCKRPDHRPEKRHPKSSLKNKLQATLPSHCAVAVCRQRAPRTCTRCKRHAHRSKSPGPQSAPKVCPSQALDTHENSRQTIDTIRRIDPSASRNYQDPRTTLGVSDSHVQTRPPSHTAHKLAWQFRTYSRHRTNASIAWYSGSPSLS